MGRWEKNRGCPQKELRVLTRKMGVSPEHADPTPTPWDLGDRGMYWRIQDTKLSAQAITAG